ncbi:MAG: RNA methyltransferase [Oscillospiraceae bacterium]|nr:RNA methyltransferase [Oscillospiraceae bacterium]
MYEAIRQAFPEHRFFVIEDFHAPELDIYARLTEAQLRSSHGIDNSLFIAESPHVIERALDAGCVPESLLMLPKMLDGRERGQEILRRCGDVPVYVAEEDCLKQLTGFPLTRGVLCAMRRPPLPQAEDLLKTAERICVLEDVMNPTNLGAIFRSAAAMGMDAILLTPASTDPLYRRCIRVSMGTVFQIPWAWLGEELDDWPERGMALLRQYGFRTAAMALREDSVSIDNADLMAEEKLAVILGTEGDGLANQTIADCDYTVRIPMAHGVDSLNVAAAGAVAFWQLGKRRK